MPHPSTLPMRPLRPLLPLLVLVLAGAATAADWLVSRPTTPVTLEPWSSPGSSNGHGGLSGFELTNGLITRRFALVSNTQ